MFRSRGLKIALIFVGVLALLALAGIYLVFPRVGEWYIRHRELPKLEARLGRPVTVERVRVHRGRIDLYEVKLGDLATIDEMSVDYDFFPALFGKLHLGDARVEGAQLTLTRAADGTSNWGDLAARLRGGGEAGEGSEGSGGGGHLPQRLIVKKAAVSVVDEQRGVKLAVDSIDGEVVPHGHAHLVLSGVTAGRRAPTCDPLDEGSECNEAYGPSFLRFGVRLAAPEIDIDTELDDPKSTLVVAVKGASAALWPKMSLTGITGTLATSKDAPGMARIDLSGGYGGADETLWTAQGQLDPWKQEGELHLRADRFTLDKIEKVLVDTPIQDPAKTSIDASLDLKLAAGTLTFDGVLEIAGLTVFHPWMSDDPIRDLSFRAALKGHYSQTAKLLDLESLDVSYRGLDAQLTAEVALPGGVDAGQPGQVDGGPREKPRVSAHFVLPQVACQTVLEAIPREVAPRLQGFRLAGKFAADVHIDVDWANLDALVLDGSIGIAGCKAVDVPPDFTPQRLNGEFDHTFEVAENDFQTITVGPSNPDFVPFAEISPYLVSSIISTEDYGFMKHRGFITREFRTALVSDLKEGYFKYGASSITMQLVKNVFLYKEKTIARKLQELFLTWYLETVLTKERELEIYLNVIEFGPGLYGIGPAAQRYFGKDAKDINPTEAAFFSSILPNPKQRYLQYCEGQLNRWGDAKVQRILKLQHERGLLTDEEYQHAMAAPLEFDRTDAVPEEECKEMTRRLIKATRPTAPGKPKPAPNVNPEAKPRPKIQH